MDFIRYLLAVTLYCLGLYLLFDLVVSGLDWLVLLSAIACLVMAHFIKPGGRQDASDLLDILDLVIDLPFKTIALALRAFGGMFRRDGGSLDLD